jgi:hypothetical protein
VAAFIQGWRNRLTELDDPLFYFVSGALASIGIEKDH